ncbi:MAG: histidinol-phosphatase HisJ family protein [Selenomonadaceae bacterium]|nr:histidinol-phosphatase HisJ family protein [Selenomonadaceae bacterium]
MIFDSHTHTKFSADSEMSPLDAIARAESLNRGIVFTDHFDYDLPNGIDFTFDPDAYFDEYRALRSDRVRLGVEIGFRKSARKINDEFIARGPFDMVIGSVHLVDDLDIYYPEYYVGKDKHEAYRRYFDTMIEESSIADYDVLGHIDYICRAAPYDDPEIDYATFKDRIDRVLSIVIERGKVLELNTRRLDSRRALKELVPIYDRYREMGGRYITIGSDAHKVEAIGNYFDAAIEFANALKLTVVTFAGRRLEICSVD